MFEKSFLPKYCIFRIFFSFSKDFSICYSFFSFFSKFPTISDVTMELGL